MRGNRRGPCWVILLSFTTTAVFAGKPAPAKYYKEAIVDHFPDDPFSPVPPSNYWTQRYYSTDEHFAGPGSPIFVIMGGEGEIPPTTGFLYPFVTDHLAVTFGALVVEPEHRFYGASEPVTRADIDAAHRHGQADPREHLLTYEQALYDASRLVQVVQKDAGCSSDRLSAQYCPVITVGGSYPGFLAAMMRIVRPDVVDMAYAASAPMKFYAQQVNQFAYYNHIAAVADAAVPGCPGAVRETLDDVQALFSENPEQPKTVIGICENTVPEYLVDADVDYFLEEVVMMVAYTFANHNMGYYPPSATSALVRSCKTFSNDQLTPISKLKQFLVDSLAPPGDSCFSMRSQTPAGPNATISGGDWSGVGTGTSGDSWDFQTCTLCVEAIGLVDGMFPYRPWSIEWLTEHCQRRFGVTPNPLSIDIRWRINDLKSTKASKILFTNGLNDGWSVSGIQKNITDDLVAINFPNGAHHSDLSGKGPSDRDTDDIKEGFVLVTQILTEWLDGLPARIKQSALAELRKS